MLLTLMGSLLPLSSQTLADAEQTYYQIHTVPIPEGVVLEVGGLAFDEQGVLAAATRRGEIWRIAQPASAQPRFSRFAHGLHEPLGLAYKDGAYYLSQRPELSRVSDTDQDGIADLYESIYVWPLSGNYHEYAYGPRFLPNGNMLVTLNLSWIGAGASLTKWRGWLLEISPSGDMKPIATGMRSPAGFGFNAQGDLFYTENQGDWVGSGRMTHVELGDFVGNPEGLRWTGEPESPLRLKFEDIQDSLGYTLYEYAQHIPEIKPPSVWFPHTIMGISTSDILVIDHDQFGPFKGQLLVGDQGHSKIMRVYQEKVKGVYQGACFGFREGFASGVLRLIWGPDHSLYAGMTSRGWASTGREPFGLQRLVWTGKTPFEMQRIQVQPDGFVIHFTEAVNPATLADPSAYQITDFTYKYHHIYGSPPINKETKTIFNIAPAADGKSVRLYVHGLRLGYVNEIRLNGLRSRSGKELLHPVAYYTLNQLPEGEKLSMHEHQQQGAAQTKELISPKRITSMPADWKNGPDQSVEIGTLPGLKYDTESFTVKAGSKVKLVFNNSDDMMHNLLIVQPGKADAVGQMAMELGLEGEEKGYVPDDEAVLFHTNLLQPESSDVIYFTAPSKPGTYPFVCTFPGHYLVMRGVMVVK